MAWVKGLQAYGPRTALVVAGDVATSLATIAETLVELKRRFEEVLYCPGNHDLWCPATGQDWSEGMEGGANSVRTTEK
eukprot:7727096-Pyramimonas_sp.AAC.1